MAEGGILLKKKSNKFKKELRYFQIKETWFWKLSPEEAVLYGLLLNMSNTLVKSQYNGLDYYWISNSVINRNAPNLKKKKIKKLLDGLVNKGFLLYQNNSKNNKSHRWVHFNVILDDSYSYDIFYDLLLVDYQIDSLLAPLILCYIINDLNTENTDELDYKEMRSTLSLKKSSYNKKIITEFLIQNGYISDDYRYLNNSIELSQKYFIDWGNKKRHTTNKILPQTVDNKNDLNEKSDKKSYGKYRHVLLSDNEFMTLRTNYSSQYRQMIDKLDNYIESSGYSPENHFANMKARTEYRPYGHSKHHTIETIIDERAKSKEI